jgi:hypothetical protein
MMKQLIPVVEPINSVLFVNIYSTDKFIENNRLNPNNRVEKAEKCR